MNESSGRVLIVGAGPAGLTAALALALQGVEVIVVTKYGGTANSPRAHITNQRTMEVFRALGIEQAVRAVATPNELMGNNVWSTSFADPEIARLMSWGSGAARRTDYLLASPCEMCNVPQHVLEPVILNAAIAAGAVVHFNTEFISLTQDDTAVRATVRDRLSGKQRVIEADYLIGADGANSAVVRSVGIALEGESGLGQAVNAWLEADLSVYCAHRPSVLYWMVRPGNDYWVGSGTWICVKPWTEWVMLFMYDPAQGDPDLSDQGLIARAHTTIGDSSVPVRVKSVNKWQINHVLACSYSSGRVFIAGDAAHRHPPANGLGSNTSVQDAFNLAWKLALVLRGKAAPALLQSYDQERRPVGRQVIDRALKSVADMRPISDALGFGPGQSEDDGWRALAELKAATDQGRARRAELDAAVALQHYQFNALGVELGQRYSSDALLVSRGESPAPPERDPELYYHPSTFPGCALPHAAVQCDGITVSTLDLCSLSGFTLFTGVGGGSWHEAAVVVSRELGVPITTIAIGPGLSITDSLGVWQRLNCVEEAGCVLVRPDRFVAWRQRQMPRSPLMALRDAMRSLLALEQSALSATGRSSQSA